MEEVMAVMQLCNYMQDKELAEKQIAQCFNFPRVPINLSCDSMIYQTPCLKIYSI